MVCITDGGSKRHRWLVPRVRLYLSISIGTLAACLTVGVSAVSATVVEADDTTGMVSVTQAGPGSNDATLDVEPGLDTRTITYSDSSVPPTAGEGCTQVGDDVECVLTSSEVILRVELGAGDDSLDAIAEASRLRLQVFLEHGDDSVDLGPGGRCGSGYTCTVHGSDGSDSVVGADSAISRTEFFGGGGNDTLTASEGPLLFFGDRGDDLMEGGPETDFMVLPDPGADRGYGGGGDDTFRDGRGADEFFGEAGEDQFHSYSNSFKDDDVIDGGTGRDHYQRTCGRCRISLDESANDGERGTPESDLVIVETIGSTAVGSSFDPVPEKVHGTGADRMLGDDERNLIFSDEGPDLIVGHAGGDLMWSGPGADVIRAADGRRDYSVRCGPGTDKVIADPSDNVHNNCEEVIIRTGE